MPPRNAHRWRPGSCFGVCVVLAMAGVQAASAQEVVLKRDYPGSGPYQCPTPAAAPLSDPDDASRAAQLATDANQALILGDFERVQALLAQSIELDPASADLAYRHGNVLEVMGRLEPAILEYCRALDLDVQSLGVTGVRQNIDVLWAQIRRQLPETARNAFEAGLAAADDSLFVEAIESFTAAMESAPGWGDPIYNRAALHEATGNVRAALSDLRAYRQVVADPDDADALAISERIGVLEGAASVSTPSPSGALALGAVPGMGHYFTRRPVPGTITLAAAAGAVAAGVLFKERTTLCLDVVPPNGVCSEASIVDQFSETPYFWYGVGVAAAITIGGAIEAYLTARRARSEADEIAGQGTPVGLSLSAPTISGYRDQVDLNLLRLRFR